MTRSNVPSTCFLHAKNCPCGILRFQFYDVKHSGRISVCSSSWPYVVRCRRKISGNSHMFSTVLGIMQCKFWKALWNISESIKLPQIPTKWGYLAMKVLNVPETFIKSPCIMQGFPWEVCQKSMKFKFLGSLSIVQWESCSFPQNDPDKVQRYVPSVPGIKQLPRESATYPKFRSPNCYIRLVCNGITLHTIKRKFYRSESVLKISMVAPPSH